MRFKPKAPERELFPAGNHNLYCYCVVHLGTFESNTPGWSPREQFLFLFEAPDLPYKVFKEGEQPRPMGIQRRTYGDKDSNNFYKELRDGILTDDEVANGWDLEKVVGKLFHIQILHEPSKRSSTTIYANISKIRSVYDVVPEGTKPMSNTRNVFSPNFNPVTKQPFQTADELVTNANFANLAPWIQNHVKGCTEFKSLPGAEKYPQQTAAN